MQSRTAQFVCLPSVLFLLASSFALPLGKGAFAVKAEGGQSAYTSDIETTWYGSPRPGFALTSNSIPVGTSLHPFAPSNMKLIRGGVTTEIGDPNSSPISKDTSSVYHVDGKSSWSDLLPFQAGDLLTLEGEFADSTSTYTLNLEKTEISLTSAYDYRVGRQSHFNAVLPSSYAELSNVSAQSGAGLHLSFPDVGTDLVPITGDSHPFYPLTADTILWNGKPTANPLYFGFKRYSSSSDFTFTLDDQGYGGQIEVGDLLVLDGYFAQDIYDFSPSTKVVHVSEIALKRISVGGNSDYALLPSYRGYLKQMLRDSFSISDYDGADQAEIRSRVQEAEAQIDDSSRSAQEVDKIARGAISFVKGHPLAQDVLPEAREEAKEELASYLDLASLREEQKEEAEAIINQAEERIDASSTASEFEAVLKDAKEALLALPTDQDLVEQDILEAKFGYEQHLVPYETVTLSSLNLGSSLSLANGFYNDDKSLSLQSSFSKGSDNPSSSCVFRFAYQTPDQFSSSSYWSLKLRGVKYYGYSFTFGVPNASDSSGNTAGFWAERSENDSIHSWMYDGTNAATFEAGKRYEVAVGAVDLKQGGRTYLFVEVDGVRKWASIVDSISHSTNPRVSFASSKAPGTILYDCAEEVTVSSRLTARPVFEGSSSDSLSFALPESSLPNGSYCPLSASCFLETKGGSKNEAGILNEESFRKIDATHYRLSLPSQAYSAGDSLSLEGDFACFDENLGKKKVIKIRKATFSYDGSSWSQVALSLDEKKEDACDDLARVDLEEYAEEDRSKVKDAISAGQAKINACQSEAEVKKAYEEALSSRDAILTIHQKHIAEAKEKVASYKQDVLSSYREEERNKLAQYKEEALTALSSASESQIDSILSSFYAKADALLTDQEKSDQKLSSAKKEGSSEIESLYASLDLASMGEAKASEVNQSTKDALSSISSAQSKEEVEKIVSEYRAKYGQKDGLSAGAIVGIALGGAALGAGVALAIVLPLRRKKKKE